MDLDIPSSAGAKEDYVVGTVDIRNIEVMLQATTASILRRQLAPSLALPNPETHFATEACEYGEMISKIVFELQMDLDQTTQKQFVPS